MHKKVFIIVSLVLALCSAAVVSQDAVAQEQGRKTGSGLSDWLKTLSKKIDRVVAKKAPPMVTAVAGVRGAKEDSRARLYWKGKAGEEVVSEEELSAFKAALELAAKGEEGAAKGLEKFMAQYPDCPLIPDAKKTLDLVKSEGK